MKLTHFLLSILVAGCAMAAASPAAAGEQPGQSERPVASGPAAPGVIPAPTPLVSELLAVVVTERRRLGELRLAIADVRDPLRAGDLEREIEALKRETERTLIQIQASRARAEGRLEAAEQLEATLAQMIANDVRPAAPALAESTELREAPAQSP